MSHRNARTTPPFHRSPMPIVALAVAALSLLPLACGPAAEAGGQGATPNQSPGTAPDARTAPEPATPPAEGVAPVRLDLPERFRGLIRAEMLQIEAAMQEELRHLARAEGAEGAEVAREIHQSFVLKQELEPEERQELRKLLPAEFVSLDRDFHQKAAELAGALDRGDFPGAAALYSEMTRACVHCHARFATERFPGFAGSDAAADAGSGTATAGR